MKTNCCLGVPHIKISSCLMEGLKKLFFPFLTVILVCAINVYSSELNKMQNLKYISEDHRQFPTEKCQELLLNCTCDDYETMVGIICSYIANFDDFSQILTNDSIFPANTSYEITLKELNVLPAESFKGLEVFRIYLDSNELTQIEHGAFDGILKLEKFQVLRSSVQVLPDFQKVRESLTTLHMDNSLLDSLDGNHLQYLTRLEILTFVNNSIQYVDADALKGTENILIFDLSYNLLKYLPPHLLDKWKRLRKIVLSHNQLLHVDSLFAVCHPRIIYLDSNNFTNVENIFHQDMFNVIFLYLNHNPIQNLSATSFNGKIPNIRFLYLDHCNIREFHVDHFRDLHNLREFDMSWNLIEVVPKQVIDFGDQMDFSLAGNRIEEFGAEVSHTVRSFVLHDNNLKSLGSTLWFSQPKQVSVARNRLQYISEDDFKGVHSTRNIELQGNSIQRIDQLAFYTLRKDLHYLDLSMNMIRTLNGSMRYLSQIISANLSGNLLQIFEENEFMGLSELSELHLQSNRIIFFGMQLQQLSQLQFLDIRNNSLVSLVPNQLPKTLQFIYIADNPFRCDCEFLSFLTWLNASSVPGSYVVPCISREADERSHEAKPCPDPCSCSCSELRGKHFMYLDCSSRNLSVLPDFLEESNETTHSLSVYLETRFNFEMSSKSKFSIHDQALGISMAHNRLQSFKSVLVHPQLLQLHFADNLLDTISTSFLYSLESLLDVTLSGNPWKCDCEAIPFRKWLLSKMSIVRDINKTLCSNNTKSPHLNSRVIWTLNDLELCPAEVLWYLISFGVLVLLLLCASGTVLYMKYQIKIKFWLYAHGFTFVKEEDLDKDKKYDAFLSYASEDEAIIRNYIEPAVERNKPNTVLCIHGRDFTGGATTVENISKSIHNSKRTIAFLSENFLNSTWCNHEFDVAYNMSINDKINRIIIVRVGELTSEVPEIIADHMNTTHYLTWGTRDFWGGFYAVLPEHQNRRVAERNMELLERPAELETLLLHR